MEEQRAALVFLMADGVGTATAARLRERHGSLDLALTEVRRGRAEIAAAKRRALEIAVRDRVWDRQLEAAAGAGARFVTFGSAGFPDPLARIARPPVGLFVQGSGLSTPRPALAIVGSRAATPRGRLFARDLAASLGAAGLSIVSGLARGIDTAAHEGALDAGAVTIAVLGSGLDHVYPRENAGLARRIAASGAVVTEFPFGASPLAEHFPMRNRIVAGCSAGVVVVEAGERSGALITASMALEEGREVFAVPGAPDDPGARGPNGLLRSGAKLVERASDVLEELEGAWGPFGGAAPAGDRSASDLDADVDAGGDEGADRGPTAGDAVRELLGRTPLSAGEIASKLGLPVREILGRLVELELAGLARAWPGGRYTRA